MDNRKKRVVWFCGLPDAARREAFSDLPLPAGNEWSWVVAHLPPPPEIELHLVCSDRRVTANITRPWRGAWIHLVSAPRGGSLLLYSRLIPRLRAEARRIAPDVVHGWGTECEYSLAAVRTSPRHVVGVQGILNLCLDVMPRTFEIRLRAMLERRVLKGALRCVAESEYACGMAAQFTRGAIRLVRHPLREEFLRAELPPQREKIITYVGVLAQRKGFFDAVEAFLRAGTDWTLVCIGTPASAEDAAAIERLRPSFGERVVLTGALPGPEIVRWFQQSPVFLLPSFVDTGPTALKEALAMGVWPICYDNTGPKELIGRYGAGDLMPTGDVAALTAAIRAACGRHAQPWPESLALAERVRGELSRNAAWRELARVYESVGEGTSRASSQPTATA